MTLANAMAARGHAVELILCQRHGDLLDEVDTSIAIVELRASRFRRSLWPLASYLRQSRPDAVIAVMWPLTLVAIVAARLAGVRTRVIVSDHTSLAEMASRKGGIGGTLLRWSVRLFYPLAFGRVAVSTGIREDLVAMGIDGESVEVIHNPMRRFDGVGSTPIAWPACGARILSVGNLVQAKNHALLLNAFAQLAVSRDCCLMICGEGPLRDALEKLTDDLGVADKVLFQGFLANPWPAYETADLFVLSSDFEGFSLVMVEALSAGLTVVSTDCRHGPAEILEGGKLGHLVAVGDARALSEAMALALDNPDEKARCIRRSQDFSIAVSLEKYEALFVAGEAA